MTAPSAAAAYERHCAAKATRVDSLPLAPMNVHHLELFYYVAKHGGISAAVRHMPYGIQQPAVSSQILQLEEDLGVKLFERQPFRLTPEGQELLAFAQPFFEKLDTVAATLNKHAGAQLRFGSSELILRDHLPAVIQHVKKKFPALKLMMRTGFQPQLEALLKNGELDLAIVTAMHGRPVPGLRRLPFVRIPLVLLVHRDSPVQSAEELWARKRIEDPLICLPAPDSVFQQGLKRLGVDWKPSVEATSLELVTWYVANGHGIGVQLNVPDVLRHAEVRALPLPGFDDVEIIALWRGEPTPVIRAVLAESQRYAKQVWPAMACDEPLP
jgi:DNA-binding transcriptional LysR family regulator